MSWKHIQRYYNSKGVRISRKQAKKVAAVMPKAQVATGWKAGMILEVTVRNHGDGATDRLLALANTGERQ